MTSLHSQAILLQVSTALVPLAPRRALVMGGGTKAEEMERSTWVRGAAGKGGTKDEAGRSGAREMGWKGSQEKDLLLG